MKKYVGFLVLALIALCFAPFMAHAQDASATLSVGDFLTQVIAAVQKFGGLNWAGKISSVVLLIIASMKVTQLNALWAKLGKLQIWAAPALGLLAGIVSLGMSGNITLAGVAAYALAGAGAVYLHELLDLVKQIPGLGSLYVTVIDMIETQLGGKSST